MNANSPAKPHANDSGTAVAGDNLKTIKETVKKVFSAVDELKNERESTNADILAQREKLKALGIDKEAFDLCSKYMGWDENKRRSFDLAYGIVRDALGVPMQADLFDSLEDNADAIMDAGPPTEDGK